jgi:hypothetical protein
VEPGWRPGDHHPDEIEDMLFEAARLYHYLTSGAALDPVATAVLLEPGESAYFDDEVECSWYYGDDFYLHESLSLTRFVVPSIRNWARRQDAEPHWRGAHITRVILTGQRLLFSDDGRWTSLWHSTIAEYHPEPADFLLTLTFHESPPLRLRGPDVASLTVAFASLLFSPEQMAQLPGFARFDPTAG